MRRINGVILALFLLLVSLCSPAQEEGNGSAKTSGSSTDATSTVSTAVLASNGFGFVDQPREKLRDGTFDLDKYRAKFLEYMEQKR
jgi:hypothetical protein